MTADEREVVQCIHQEYCMRVGEGLADWDEDLPTDVKWHSFKSAIVNAATDTLGRSPRPQSDWLVQRLQFWSL